MKQPSKQLRHFVRSLAFSQRLALARTLMANQRTGLSYLKAVLGLLASGYALIKIGGHPLLEAFGVMGLIGGVLVMIAGLQHYFHMRTALSKLSIKHMKGLELLLMEPEPGDEDDRDPKPAPAE